MPAFVPPLILGGLMAAGRIGASVAARQAARTGVRAATQAARTAKKTTAPRAAGSTARKTTKKTAAARKKEAISKLSASDRKRYEAAVSRAQSFGGKTQIKSGRGKLTVAKNPPKKINQPRKPTAAQMQQAKSARDSWAATVKPSKAAKGKMSKKKKAAIGGAVVGGVGTLAYATKPKSMGSEGPKRRSPVSPVVGGKKRKNVVRQRGGAIRFRG